MTQLMMPNMINSFNAGVDRGKQNRLSELAGQAYNANPQQQNQLVGQMVGLNPRQGLAVGGILDQRQATQRAAVAKKVRDAAMYVYQAAQSGDPQKADQAYQAVRPTIEGVTGHQMQPNYDPSMLPHIEQLLVNTGGVPAAPKPISVAPGATLVDPNTHQQIFKAPQKPHISYQNVPDGKGGTTLQEFDQNGKPIATLGHNPHITGPGKAPSGYRFNPDGSLSAIKGGPADFKTNSFNLTPGAVDNLAWDFIEHGHTALSGLGRSKESLAVRAKVMNKVAGIANQAGISPADLSTQQGRVKAMQSSLQNLQKQSDMIERNSETFRKNLDLMQSIAARINQNGPSAWNQFVLHLKNKYTADPQVAAYMAAAKTAAQEYAKIAAGSTGSAGSTDASMQHAYDVLNTSYSLDQLHAVGNTLEQDVRNQKQASEERLLNVAGRMQELGIHGQYPGHPYQPSQGQPQPQSQPNHQSYHVGQIINVGGKRYKVTGGDMHDPNVEPVQ